MEDKYKIDFNKLASETQNNNLNNSNETNNIILPKSFFEENNNFEESIENVTDEKNDTSYDQENTQNISQTTDVQNNIENEEQPVVINDNTSDNASQNDIEPQNSNLSKKENIFSKISNNKKILSIIIVLTFTCVCIVVLKTFNYRNKIDKYEEVFIKIDKKEESEAKVYSTQKINNEILKKVAATNLISCINSNVDINNLPDTIKNRINEINNYYDQSNNYFAFSYKDLYTGFTVSYNANQNIFSASSIKAPKDIYIYEMASQGKIDLDEQLTYTSNYYNTGSGLLKNKQLNTKYNIRTLLQYSTVDSDNAAHNMLMDRYGRENILNFWKNKGTTAIFTLPTNWGVTNAHDATIYMEELYKFYLSNEKYGNEIMQNFLNSYPKFIKGKNNYEIASKSGWAGSVLHEMTIVFADNPYIVIGLSNLGDKPNYQEYFNKVNDLAYNLHTEYWKYKINTCEKIKQY